MNNDEQTYKILSRSGYKPFGSIMAQFAVERRGSSLSDLNRRYNTHFKLFVPFVPICSQSISSVFAIWDNSLGTILTDFSALRE